MKAKIETVIGEAIFIGCMLFVLAFAIVGGIAACLTPSQHAKVGDKSKLEQNQQMFRVDDVNVSPEITASKSTQGDDSESNQAVIQAIAKLEKKVENTVGGDQYDRYISWMLAGVILVTQVGSVFGNRFTFWRKWKHGKHYCEVPNGPEKRAQN